MKNNLTIYWNGNRVMVDVQEANNSPIFVLHMPREKKQIISHIDELGIERWLERGKGETADSAQLGELIDMARYQDHHYWGI
jgi:hypothetical protein